LIGSLFEENETMQPPERLPEGINRSISPHIPLTGGSIPQISRARMPLPSGMPPLPKGLPPLPKGLPPLPGGLPSQSFHSSVSVGRWDEIRVAVDMIAESATELLGDIEQTRGELEQLERLIEVAQEASKLRKKARVFSQPDSTETWASRWIASPIAYLFPEIQQEEWLGDLYETNYKMLRKGRHRWELNVNNIVRTIELIESALRVKLSGWVSLLKDLF
jgi:hypothetical protein